MRIGWIHQVDFQKRHATNLIGWFLAFGIVYFGTVTWAQTGAQERSRNGRIEQKATGTVLLNRFDNQAGQARTKHKDRVSAQNSESGVPDEKWSNAEPEVMLEPPKLRPLNRIDVRTASTGKLVTRLPAAAQPQEQKPDYRSGSPYQMTGNQSDNILSAPVEKSGPTATLIAHSPSSSTEVPEGEEGDRQVSVAPSVSRRPLPGRIVQDQSRVETSHVKPNGDLPKGEPSGDTALPAFQGRPSGDTALPALQAKSTKETPLGDLPLPELPSPSLDPPSLPDSQALNPPEIRNDRKTEFDSPPSGSVSGQFQRVDGNAGVPLGVARPANHHSGSTLRDSNRLEMRSPRVQVVMDGPAQVALGVSQTYKVLVSNVDVQTLQGLVLRLEIPQGIKVSPKSPTHGQCQLESLSDGATLINWDFENLAQSGTAALPLDLTAETTSDFAVSMEWTFQPFSAVAAMQVMSPRLELKLEGPSEVDYGRPSTYRLRIRNPGNADATDVALQLTAQQYGSSSTVIGKIPAGGEESMEVELTFKQAGSIQVAAEAKAAGNLSSKSEVRVLVRQAQLDLYWDSPEVAYYGSAMPYVLHLKNTGDASAAQVRTVIQLPAEATVVSMPQNAAMEDGKLVWTVAEVGPGSLEELSLQVAFHREGENELSASCFHSVGTPAERSTVTLVQAITDLKLVVNDPAAPAKVGGEVIYEMTLENRGSKTAESVSVVALFSKDIEPVRAEGLTSKIFPGQVRFDAIPQLRPGETIHLKIFAVAELAGMHRFRAEVNTANTEIKLVQEETTQYIESVRRTAKSAEASVIR